MPNKLSSRRLKKPKSATESFHAIKPVGELDDLGCDDASC